ncbi:hypothetical protein Nepgr_009616 [Nepenthes gracilis]|uniref:Uncharacterized protein n=1 Tax=Nepenthes gracilis TaxID=150966 RepID=A0AAD3SBK2_NEPGR|nr:hypothetical protein Nepgr_009616 [Nepenthes gracilis]
MLPQAKEDHPEPIRPERTMSARCHRPERINSEPIRLQRIMPVCCYRPERINPESIRLERIIPTCCQPECSRRQGDAAGRRGSLGSNQVGEDHVGALPQAGEDQLGADQVGEDHADVLL